HDIPRLVANAGDIAEAAVRAAAEVAHHNPSGRLQFVEGPLVSDVAALAVLDRDDDFRAGPVAPCPYRDHVLDNEPLVSADEPSVVVAYQRTGQQVRFAKYLEAVAYPEHGQAVASGGDHSLHDRREPRDRAAPQVVAVRESARKDHRIDVGQDRVRVPERHRVTTGDPYGTLGVAVVEAAGKCHDTETRGHRLRLLGQLEDLHRRPSGNVEPDSCAGPGDGWPNSAVAPFRLPRDDAII